MGIMNEVKSGTDLTKPRPLSASWYAVAAIAVAALLAAIAIGVYIFGVGKKVVSPVTAKITGMASQGTSAVTSGANTGTAVIGAWDY